jgi:DNA-binding transcriptional LysR family regulator
VIRIMASDYITEVLLASALNELHEVAPAMRFEIQSMTESLVETLERGFVDVLITIDYAISPDHPSQILFEDDYVVVGWNQNPAMAGPMTRETYFSLGHVVPRFGRSKMTNFDDWFMRRQKQTRNVEIVTPSFLTMPSFVIGSNRIATMHRRMANRLSTYHPLTIREVPLDIPTIREAIQWHISNNNDPAIRWVVERLSVAASQKAEHSDGRVVSLDSAKRKGFSHEEIAAQFQESQKSGGR